MPRMWAKADKSQWESPSVNRFQNGPVMPRAAWKELLQPCTPHLPWTLLWCHRHRVRMPHSLPSSSSTIPTRKYSHSCVAAQVLQDSFLRHLHLDQQEGPGGSRRNPCVTLNPSLQCGWEETVQWFHGTCICVVSPDCTMWISEHQSFSKI